jgi:hypothetical protein
LRSSNIIPLIILMSIILLAGFRNVAAEAVEFTPTETHHVIELNSNQPYVAGYHVDTRNLYTRERVEATSIMVDFPSTESDSFPADSWLGAGMFVQGQDSKLKHVDYAYYTMLVIDSQGNFFIDIGLHQTRESTAPLQMPTEELVYAYTWQISGLNYETPAILSAHWSSDEYLHYSISAAGTNTTLLSIKVSSLPNCESAISRFYAGNAIAGSAFPQNHYVYYFQFGVVSNRIISNDHWSVHLREPRVLRKSGWSLVETSWSTQGDISYLDYDWVWGGAPYEGASAKYRQSPLQDPHEIIFLHTGQTLPPGTILWESTMTSDISMIPPTVFNQPVNLETISIIGFELALLTILTISAIRYHRSPKNDVQKKP